MNFADSVSESVIFYRIHRLYEYIVYYTTMLSKSIHNPLLVERAVLGIQSICSKFLVLDLFY